MKTKADERDCALGGNPDAHGTFMDWLVKRVFKLQEIIREARGHLYTKQDMVRVRAMAKEALPKRRYKKSEFQQRETNIEIEPRETACVLLVNSGQAGLYG